MYIVLLCLYLADVLAAALLVGAYWWFNSTITTTAEVAEFVKPAFGSVGSKLFKRALSGAAKELLLFKHVAALCLHFHLLVRVIFAAYAILRIPFVLVLK